MPATPAGIGQWAIVQAAAAAAGMEVKPLTITNPGVIDSSIAAFAREPGDGLVVQVSTNAVLHRDAIISSTARHRLSAVYHYRHFVTAGGLIAYSLQGVAKRTG